MARLDDKLTELEAAIEDVAGKESIEDAEEEALRAEIADLKARIEAGTATDAQVARFDAAVARLKAAGFGDVTEPAPAEGSGSSGEGSIGS